MPISRATQELRAARATHKAWVIRAEAILSGMPLDKDSLPVGAEVCSFGKWYSSSKRSLQGFSVFDELEISHFILHQNYANIYKLLTEDSGSGLGNIFGQGNKQKKVSHKEASLLLPKLQRQYEEMIVLLGTLEKDLLKKESREPNPMEKVQASSFRNVSSMMEDLDKDLNTWLK